MAKPKQLTYEEEMAALYADDAEETAQPDQVALAAETPIVDTGDMPGSPQPEAAPPTYEEEMAALYADDAPQQQPPPVEHAPESMTGKMLQGGVEMFNKYVGEPTGLTQAIQGMGQFGQDVIGERQEFLGNIMEDPAAVLAAQAHGVVQGAADLGDTIYNTGAAMASNPDLELSMPYMKMLGKAGDILKAPKTLDMKGAYLKNPIPQKMGKNGKPLMPHTAAAYQMVGQAPAGLASLNPATALGKVGAGALLMGGQGTAHGVSEQMKAGQKPDVVKAFNDEGKAGAWTGATMAGALHPLVKKGAVEPPEGPAYGPPTPPVAQPGTSLVRPLKPMEFKAKKGDYLDLSEPKQGYLDLSPDPTKPKFSVVTRKKQGYLDLRQEPKPSAPKETPSAKPKQDYLDLDQQNGPPAPDVVDAEILQHFGDKPDVHRAIEERVKAIVEASDDDAGRMLDEAMREIKASSLEDSTKALLRRKASQAYEANEGSIGYKEPKAKAEVKAKSEPVAPPEPAKKPTVMEALRDPEHQHELGKKAGWRRVPKDGGGSQNVIELVDKNGSPIAGPNGKPLRHTWGQLKDLEGKAVSDAAHDAFQAARAGKKQPTVAKAAEVKEGVPLKGKAEVEAQPEPVHKSVKDIRQDAIKKKQAAKEEGEHGDYIAKKNKLRASLKWQEETQTKKMYDAAEADPSEKNMHNLKRSLQEIEKKTQALEDLTNEYMKEKNLSRAEVDKLTTAWEDDIAAQMEHAEAVKSVAKDAAESVGVKKLGGVKRSQSGSINLGAITSSGAKIGVGISKAFAKLKLSPLGVKMNIGGFAAKYGARAATLFKNTKSVAGRKAIVETMRGYKGLLSDLEIIKKFDPHGLHANMWVHIGMLDEMSRNAPDFYASIAKREAFASASDMTPKAIRNSKELAKTLSKDEIEWIAKAKNEADQIAESVKEAWETEEAYNGKGTEYAKFLARYHESVTGGRDVRTGDKPTAEPHQSKGVLKFAGNAFYDMAVKGSPRVHFLHVMEALLNGQAELGFRNFWVGAVNAFKDPTVSKFVNSYGNKGRLQQARYGGEVGVLDKFVGRKLEGWAKKSKAVDVGMKVVEKAEGSFIETKKIAILRAGALEKIAPEMGYKSAAALIKDFESGKMPEHQMVMVSSRMAEHLYNTSGYNPLFVVNRRGWARVSKEVGKNTEAFTTMREVQSAMGDKIWGEALASGKWKDITPVLMYQTQLALLTGVGTIPKAARIAMLGALGPGIYNEIEKHLEKCRIFGSSNHHMSPDGIPIVGFAFDTLSGIRDQIYQAIEGGPDSFLTAKGIKKGGGMVASALLGGKGIPSPNQAANLASKLDDARRGYAERAVIDQSNWKEKPSGMVGVTGYNRGDALAEWFFPGEINKVHHEVTETLHRDRMMSFIRSKYGPEAAKEMREKLSIPALDKDGQPLRDDKGRKVTTYQPDSKVNWSVVAESAKARYTSEGWREKEKAAKAEKEAHTSSRYEAKHEGRHNAEEHHEDEPEAE